MDVPEDGVSRAALVREVARIVGVEPGAISGREDLVRLGVGSVDLMRLVNALRMRGLPVTFAELAAEPTIDGWCGRLRTLARTHPYWRAAS
ncbi:MAG TPA: phosphopantetheine-binding protein [Actinophytocola sp.]|uniref:phosphopantetheine-binding protein n=1 Tax=Actinophytocola sp. TaxID=1872138 RepID=UPI002DB90BB4|nr:phosphopantetheine-binding protein [Actinophytocola sp.]HEU5471215.1 phosphopantetheine-binding protein [Actinophytocola sp.]